MKDLVLKEENLINRIYFIRGEKVMLDFDLAMLYETENRKLKQAVRRNIKRFPNDFMFELTKQEAKSLLSQFVIPIVKILNFLRKI
ncbi:MAG: ORF6N domain-containing protein [Erysipelotrichaceae bacterium]|nr:ORF6N domain-containing protein [Erysipelotrichaceae bacterium]